MKKFTLIIGLALMGIESVAFAQPAEFCKVALTEQAFNKTKISNKSETLMASRDNVCSKAYSNVGEARASARNSGFSLGYAGFSIGASDAKQNTNGSWDISQTSFCRASKTDMKSSIASDYESQVTSVALSAWRDCVKISNENVLYLEYEESLDGNRFTGILRATANRGSLGRKITGISVVGPAGDSVTCVIGGAKYIPKKVSKQHVQMKTTGTSVACEKSDVRAADVAFQTSEGALPFVKLPSEKEKENAEWQLLNRRVSKIEAIVAALSVDTGVINISAVNTRPLKDTSRCPTNDDALRGNLKGRQKFKKPFKTPPLVSIGLTTLDFRGGEPTDTSRISIQITSIDKAGFDYQFYTWCRTAVASAQASWIAVAGR